MQALVVNHAKLLLGEKEKPDLRKGEAILGVRKAGICGTDLAIASGDYKIDHPVVLGHEIYGVIESMSPESKLFAAGSRVTTEINVSCNSCELCKAGLRNHCANIRTLGIDRDGGFADFVSTPLENLHLVPDSVSDEEAVFVEPLAAAIELTKMSTISEDSTVAVVGIGRLGLLILQVLKLQKPKLLVAVTHHKGNSRKNEWARSFGCDEIISSDDETNSFLACTKGIGFDHVIEASGKPSGLDFALKIVRPRGTVHVKSTHGLPVSLDVTKIVVKEIRIQGSRCGPFDQAIEMVRDRKILTRDIITSRFPLQEFEKAFAAARNSNQIKVIFDL
jgi:alcohol dehydrogenase